MCLDFLLCNNAALTENLLRDEADISSPNDGNDEDSRNDSDVREWFEDDDLEEAPEYAASMVLFPLKEDPDKALAYLLGGWPALLNTTSVIPSFGLKIVTSIGVVTTLKDQHEPLSNIKEIVTETRRLAKPIKGAKTQQKGLGAIKDFDIDPSSDGLEKVRLKPIARWGNALLEGDDFFKFRLTTHNQKMNKEKEKTFNQRYVMYEVAKAIYAVYATNLIHNDFLPFLDEPVNDETSHTLNENLEKNWHRYFNEEPYLYMHWTFWFRARNDNAQDLIKSIKDSKGTGTIAIGGQSYKPTQLVRSLPIPSPFDQEENYYWFDRGLWYRMPAVRFEIIRKKIKDITVPQEVFSLPDYVHLTNSDDYKELAYNKAAVDFMIKQTDKVSEALLLDRENVPLGGRDDKFEFADILMQQPDGKYFLIHVKRERSRDIDHHRTQVERCALYLGENFNRSALPSLLIADILDDFYKTHITLPQKEKRDQKTGETKIVDEEKSTTFRNKMADTQKKPTSGGKNNTKKKKHEDFFKFVKEDLLNVNKKERIFIKNLVTSDLIKPLIVRFEPYERALGYCLDALEDYVLYASTKRITNDEMAFSVIREDRTAFVERFFETVLAFLDKHASLTRKHQGILPEKDRNTIHIVLAVIGDGSGKEDFHLQQLWGMDQTIMTPIN